MKGETGEAGGGGGVLLTRGFDCHWVSLSVVGGLACPPSSLNWGTMTAPMVQLL